MDRSPWHNGEDKIHTTLGVTEKMHSLGRRMIRDHMPDQHREFYESLEFVILSALDKNGDIWPFVWAGPSGFISSPDAKTLIIDRGPLVGQPDDLLLGVGDKISLLGIVPETKRRNRMNGTITRSSAEKITITVDQSYGNCPRYIHVREKGKSCVAGTVETRKTLSPEDKVLIRAASTLFIASRPDRISDDPRDGIDVNHRGGLPGFVIIRSDDALIIPDYHGNNFFNTFGNILKDSRVGLLIPNFDTGDLLTLSGHGEVIFNDPADTELYGSDRYLIVSPRIIRKVPQAFPYIHKVAEYSLNPPEPPTNPKTIV